MEKQALTDILRSSSVNGTIERSKLSAALRTLDPELWEGQDFDTLLSASGFSGNDTIRCEDFVNWLYSSIGFGQRPLQAVQFRWPQLGRVPQISNLDERTTVEYLTDVEGNWEYFVHFVSYSKVLYWEGEDLGLWGPGVLMLRENGILVFGGDAPDNGPGDIRFVKTLLSLKRRYWSQVFIVLGNRDLNKLRLHAELADGEDGEIFESHGGAYWEPFPKRTPDYVTYIAENSLEKGLMSTLQWMLDTNLHAPLGFRCRKYELALLYGKASDADVLRSFRESVNPSSNDPWMLDLLRVGQLAVLLGNTLFVHGGLREMAVGAVPGQEKQSDVQSWVAALNKWKDSEIADYEARPLWRLEDGIRKRGGEGLIDYGVPGGANDQSVVYVNPFSNGNPQTLSEVVEDFLFDSGIARLLSGHQPHGESPTVVRHFRTGILAITCDTSFSNVNALKLFNPANNRGDVVSSVRLVGEEVHVEGTLKDGMKHGFTLHCRPNEDNMPDALVGRQLNDGSWVKTVMENKSMLIALGRGFRVSMQAMHPSKACLLLKPDYAKYRNGTFAVPLHRLTGEVLLKQERDTEFCPGDDLGRAMSGFSLSMNGSSLLQEYDGRDFNDADTYICDGHGTLWSIVDITGRSNSKQLEHEVIEKVNSIISSGKRIIFATNDSNCSRNMFVDKLLERGINICNDSPHSRKAAKNNVVTAAYTCAWFLKNARIKKPFVLCSHSALLDELNAMGVDDYVATVDEHGRTREEWFEPASHDNVMRFISQYPDVDAVVVGWDHNLTALKVSVAAAYLKLSRETADTECQRNPIQIITCASDEGGVLGITPSDFCSNMGWSNLAVPALGNGTMSNAICVCAGEKNRAIDVGKPSEVLIELLRRPIEEEGYGVDLSRAVVIGDTLSTDIELANRSGMRSLLVLSGVTCRADLEQEENPARMPTWVTESVAHIQSIWRTL